MFYLEILPRYGSETGPHYNNTPRSPSLPKFAQVCPRVLPRLNPNCPSSTLTSAETAARSCHRTKAVRGIQSVYTRSNMSTSFGHFPSSNVDYTRAVVPSFVTASLLRAYTQAGRRFAAPGSRSCRPAHLHNAINAKQIEHWPNKLPKRCSGRATPAAPRPRV